MYKICKNFNYRKSLFSKDMIRKIYNNINITKNEEEIIKEAILVANHKYYLDNKHEIFNKYTTKQYIKRMSDRTTPYGLFASVGIGTTSENLNPVKKSYKKMITVDYEWIYKLIDNMGLKREVILDLDVKWNPNIFEMLNNYKLIISDDTGSIIFTKTRLVEYIRELSNEPIRVSKLIESILYKSADKDYEQVLNLISNLIKNKILISSLYFKKEKSDILENFINNIENVSNTKSLKLKLVELKSKFNKYSKTDIGEGTHILEQILQLMKNICNIDNLIKVDLINREVRKLNSKNIKRIEETVNFISLLNPQTKNKSLDGYIDKFLDKYGEYREINILELFDEDIGIGSPYKIFSRDIIEDTSEINLFKQFFYGEIINSIRSKNKEIYLTDKSIDDIYGNSREILNIKSKQIEGAFYINNEDKIVLNNFLFSNMKGKIFGRFAHYFNNKDFEYNNDFINIIEFPKSIRSLNLLSEKINDNRNLKLGMFEADDFNISKIRVGVFRNKNKEFRFYFKDDKNEIVKFDTFSMLNIKSPYNFSDIGRFLIEASLYDYEIPFISCSLLNNIDLFPYIPRILYKDVIIFEEKWILRKRDIQSIEKFNKWRCIWNVPKMVYMEQGDERIILNLDDINDREYLFKKTKEYSSLRKVDLEDKDEVEYVFSFDREDESEKFKKNTLNMSSLSRRNFLIDDEWVYIKCFGISTSIRILISKYLRNFALEMFKKEIIEEFHYLNYYDEDRRSLRVRFKKASKGGLRDINKFFNNLIENNIIQEISINMYSRELERYEFKNNIEVVENIFTMSSMATSYMLINKKFNINNRDDIFYIINSIFILLKILNVNLDLFFFTLDKELEYKTYRREYRRLFINNNQVFQKFSKYLLDNYYEKFESDDLINYYNIMKEFSKYRLSDYSFSMDTILGIVHMQINRLIISNKDEYYIMCIIRHIMHDLRNINYEKFK